MPALGPRGEGWVAIQLALVAAIVTAGFVGGPWPGALRYPALAAGVVVAAGGAALAVGGAWTLGRDLTPFPRPREGAALVTEGIYGRARHPIYGGLVLLSLGWALATTSVWAIGFSAGLWLVLGLKSRREEIWLEAREERYAAYRRSVPRRLFPWLDD